MYWVKIQGFRRNQMTIRNEYEGSDIKNEKLPTQKCHQQYLQIVAHAHTHAHAHIRTHTHTRTHTNTRAHTHIINDNAATVHNKV